MNLDRLIEFVTIAAEQHERSARHVSGEGEAAEIYRTIAAELGKLVMRPMASAPRDGTDILLVTTTGVVSASYQKGEGEVTTSEGTEYWGPEWSCYDAAFSIEIEETPEGEHAAEVKGWMPMPDAKFISKQIDVLALFAETVECLADLADAADRRLKRARENLEYVKGA